MIILQDLIDRTGLKTVINGLIEVEILYFGVFLLCYLGPVFFFFYFLYQIAEFFHVVQVQVHEVDRVFRLFLQPVNLLHKLLLITDPELMKDIGDIDLILIGQFSVRGDQNAVDEVVDDIDLLDLVVFHICLAHQIGHPAFPEKELGRGRYHV